MGERPPSPDFHGFESDTFIPGRLEIETRGTGDEEKVVKVWRKRKRGNQRLGCGVEDRSTITKMNILPDSEKFDLNHNKFSSTSTSSVSSPPSTPSSSLSGTAPAAPPASAPTPSAGTRPKLLGIGTSSRPKVYLLDSQTDTFGFAKLPKSKAVLGVFLHNLKDSDPDKAAGRTTDELKDVWRHHFGMRVILGYDSAMKEISKKIISDDKYIKTKILNLWKDWKLLLKTSQRKERAAKPAFKEKEKNFVDEVLDMPFNIANRNYESVLKSESGIKDWKEDLKHLHNQLQKEQIGACDGIDMKQKKRDDRKVKDKFAGLDSAAGSDMDEIEEVDDDEDLEIEDRQDEDFNVKEKRNRAPKMVDVMGPVTVTADRLGLSMTQRTMMKLGVDVDKTNISRTNG